LPSRVEKLRAYTSHLLDAFIRLRERYAMLEPLIFDKAVVTAYGGKSKSYGFRILRDSLFLSCAQDIAKLCFDGDERSTSIAKLVEQTADPDVLGELKDAFVNWRLPNMNRGIDPEVLAAVERIHLRENDERRGQYDELRTELETLWMKLAESKVTNSFRTIRDKIAAHTEIKFLADKYQVVDFSSLDLKWGNMKETIDIMQRVVELLQLLVRNAGFAWDMLDEQVADAATEFWSVPEGAR
jgi:hypothetical protein